MKALFIRVVGILLCIAVLVLIYLGTVWVLGMLGIHVPPDILRVIFVIFGLLVVLYAVTGRMDDFWLPPPRV